MTLENVTLTFNPQFNLQALKLNPLQSQYLAYLVAQDSIHVLCQRLYQSGWLVNFVELYALIEKLVLNKAINNPEVINVFNQNYSKLTTPSGLKSFSLDDVKTLSFFKSFPKNALENLLKKVQVKTYLPEQVIYREGETSRDLCVLLNGQAAIFKAGSERQRFVSLISAGSIFGEAGFFTGHARNASLVCQKKCEVLYIPYQPEIMDQILHQDKVEKILQRFWIQQALMSSDFFKNLPSDSLEKLIFSGSIKNFTSGQVIFNEGDLSHSAFLIIQGQVQIFQMNNLINTLSQGGFLGEISLLLNAGARSASAICQSNVLVVEIARDRFYQLMAENLFLAKDIQSLAQQRLDKDQLRQNKN